MSSYCSTKTLLSPPMTVIKAVDKKNARYKICLVASIYAWGRSPLILIQHPLPIFAALWRIEEDILRKKKIKQAGFGSSRSFKVVSSQIPSGSRLYSLYDYTRPLPIHSFILPLVVSPATIARFQLFLVHSFCHSPPPSRL